MIFSFLADELDKKSRYFLMTGAIVPRPIAFVATVSQEGIANLAPYSFFNAFSASPPVVGFSAATKPDGSLKDTHRNLLETGECVIQLVDYSFAEKMNRCGADFASGINEFEAVGFESIASDLVKAPRVKESPFQMECKLIKEINLGAGFTKAPGAGNLLLCEVLKFHIDEKYYDADNQKVRSELLDAVGRYGVESYIHNSPNSVFSLERPSI
jgi:flavin reductase (DIM6/NTAB) family NADH-FMN oxidoreductase RutF